MLIDIILNFLGDCIIEFIEGMPAIEFTLPESTFDTLKQAFGCIGYLLPMTAITPILTYIVAKTTFRAAYAVWLLIKSYIPTISGS